MKPNLAPIEEPKEKGQPSAYELFMQKKAASKVEEKSESEAEKGADEESE